MLVKNFEELDLFKLGREFVKDIYCCTSKGNFCKDYGLKDQLQRASVSVILNVAEGFDSGSSRSMIVFLRYAFRSASEAKAILYVALDLNYISPDTYKTLKEKTIRLQQMTSRFIKYLEKRSVSKTRK